MPFPRSAGEVRCGCVRFRCALRVGEGLQLRYDERTGLTQLRPDDLGAQDRLVEVELAVQLLHDRGGSVEVDDGVDALGLLVDLERQPPPAPHVDLVHGAAAVADDVEERVERGSDGPLLEIWIEDDHELVVTQQTHLLLWTMRPRTIRGRRAFASANSAEATSAARRRPRATTHCYVRGGGRWGNHLLGRCDGG